MNILLIATGIRRDAKEATSITTLLMANYLKSHGHTPIILSEQRGSQKKEMIGSIPVYRAFQIHIFHSFYPIRLLNAFIPHAMKIRDIEKQENLRFDIIHSFSSAPLLALRSIISRSKAKKVHTIKSWSREPAGNRFKKILNRMDLVTVPTAALKKHISGIDIPIRLIRSPIRLSKFKPQDKQALKKRLGYKGKKIVLNYGGVWENKGTDLIFDAIPGILKKVPDAHFIFLPRNIDWFIKDQEKKARTIGIEKHMTIIKENVLIWDWVAMADCVLLPYRTLISTEANPSCLLEAMAAKTPVVTSDIPELREIARPGIDVLMVPPGNLKEIEKAVITVLTDENVASTLTENAYLSSRSFDIEVIGKELLELYSSLK